MAVNKRVSSRRPKTSKDLLAHNEPPTAHKQRLAGKSQDIHAEIHRLECFISAAPRISRQQRLARINVVPPHEMETPAHQRKHVGRLPLQQQIAIKRERMLLLAELGIIGISIVGIIGWLNQHLHFLR